MKCDKCESDRIAQVGAKCSDRFDLSIKKANYDGYVPGGFGIGVGDYIRFSLCLNCGKLQGRFPLPPTQIEVVGE